MEICSGQATCPYRQIVELGKQATAGCAGTGLTNCHWSERHSSSRARVQGRWCAGSPARPLQKWYADDNVGGLV